MSYPVSRPVAGAQAAVAAPQPPVTSFSSEVTIHVNGRPHSAQNLSPKMSLNEFLRDRLSLVGTKISCNEGGCGACAVLLSWNGPAGHMQHASINSCLRPAVACNGMHVTTVEGVGSARNGYHPVQQRLADCNGTQCGYCSPGMVMNMVSLLTNAKGELTEADIEKNFDGNICRCTGYRSILEAMKSFAADLNLPSADEVPNRDIFPDIEEMPRCPRSGKVCGGKCHSGSEKGSESPCSSSTASSDSEEAGVVEIKKPAAIPRPQSALGYVHKAADEESVWVECTSITQLNSLLQQYASQTKELVVGHTSWGVNKSYPNPPSPQVYINIRGIDALQMNSIAADGVVIGAATPITKAMEFIEAAVGNNNTWQMRGTMLLAHLQRVAHHLVRNIGCLAGNLMLGWEHQSAGNSFPSDVIVSLMGLGATAVVHSNDGKVFNLLMTDFLAFNMKPNGGTQYYIHSINIPLAPAKDVSEARHEVYRSYKTAIRHVNAHALVNASMRATIHTESMTIVSATLAYGGIRDVTSRMPNTEKAMVGLSVTDITTFRHLCTILEGELALTGTHKAAYRKSLAQNYLYKFFLSLQPSLAPELAKAAEPWLLRPVSKGTQAWQPHPTEWPVDKGIPKLTAPQQCAGEAKYSGDVPVPSDCLHAAPVLSTVASGTVTAINAKKALEMAGVTAVYSAKDLESHMKNVSRAHTGPDAIAGRQHQHVEGKGKALKKEKEVTMPVFAEKVVAIGQPVAMVVADSERVAQEAAKLVEVTYGDKADGIFTIKEAIAAGSFWDINYRSLGFPLVKGDFQKAYDAADHKVKGVVECGSQYHFYMETQTCLAVMEEGTSMTLHHATQMPQIVQMGVSSMLGVPQSDITVKVSRVGGGYGGKIDNSMIVSQMAAFGSYKLGKPVKARFSIQDCTEALGGRTPYQASFEVGFSKTGKISALNLMVYGNSGDAAGDSTGSLATLLATVDNCYNIPNWTVNGKLCKTNIPACTATRGPGWAPAVYIMESIMNRVGRTLSTKPTEFAAIRESNFYTRGDTTPTGDILTYFDIPKIWSQIKESSKISQLQAEVEAFNKANKFRKKGLSLNPVKFGVGYGEDFTILIDIYMDGSVAFNTGGIEMGQGLDVKVSQVIARELGCDVKLIRNEPTSTAIHNLNQVTGGSIGSELCCLAAIHTCQPLAASLNMARKALGEGATWGQIVGEAYRLGATMSNDGRSHSPSNHQGSNVYNSYSSVLSEVEVDVLTGEIALNRVDILFDCGISLNPMIDVGQIEGAFMMGAGYYLMEERDWIDGKLFNNGTWEYKPPSALDIPLNWNISLLRNAPNPHGVLGSKAIGEPPLCGACSTLFAVEDAVNDSVRDRVGTSAPPVYLNAPATVDKVQQAANVTPTQFVF